MMTYLFGLHQFQIQQENVGVLCAVPPVLLAVNTSLGQCWLHHCKLSEHVGSHCSQVTELMSQHVGSHCTQVTEPMSQHVGSHCTQVTELVSLQLGLFVLHTGN